MLRRGAFHFRHYRRQLRGSYKAARHYNTDIKGGQGGHGKSSSHSHRHATKEKERPQHGEPTAGSNKGEGPTRKPRRQQLRGRGGGRTVTGKEYASGSRPRFEWRLQIAATREEARRAVTVHTPKCCTVRPCYN
jgi:hypothetical protein